jgi:GBP family porin
MKKSLFALAALGAFATAAQAQSSVTLYGNLDSGIGHFTGLSPNNTQLATQTAAADAAATGSATGYVDSQWATSLWGMRGTEDIGGGRTASFNLESDVGTSNGGNDTRGLFRRAAFVSLADKTLGSISLGRQPSAFIQATTQMLPVSGNTAHQWRTVGRTSMADQVSNAVSYTTPRMMGTTARVQYAFSNSVDEMDAGSFAAFHLVNTSIKNLTVLAAYNNAQGQTGAGTYSANGTLTAGAAGASLSAANPGSINTEGYAVGLKYKFTPAIELGAFFANGKQDNTQATTFDAKTDVYGIGLGYQATPAILLAANYAATDKGASMINLQSHYSLSKRTRLYGQITLTSGADTTNEGGGLNSRSFSPGHGTGSVAGTANSFFSALGTAGGQGNTKASANGYVVGVIHSF